jgi:hypothetical protein
VADLPARDISDIHLADLFDEPGCPLCLERDRSAARLIQSLLFEGVNDVGLRRELDNARGFCRTHTHQLLAANRSQSGGTAAAAILFGAILAIRRREVERAGGATGRSRAKRVADASLPAACPVCGHATAAERTAAGRFLRLSADPAWAEALGAAPFCLDHLLALMAVPRHPPSWAAIEAKQLDRIRTLDARLDGAAHHSSHDRRHLMTDEERAAADAAARLLGGEP